MTERASSWPQLIWQGLKGWASVFSPHRSSRHQNPAAISHEFIIIGLGRFGTSLAATLLFHNRDVLAIDVDLKRVQHASLTMPHAVQLDATDVDALREVGAESFDTGVVCIGTNFEANLLATFNLRRLGVRRVITKALTRTQQDILLKVGADEVILPEHEAGTYLARRLVSIDFTNLIELSQDKGVMEIPAPGRLVGQSLKEANIRQQYDLTVIAIRRGNDAIISPRADEVIQERDTLVVLGRVTDGEKLR